MGSAIFLDAQEKDSVISNLVWTSHELVVSQMMFCEKRTRRYFKEKYFLVQMCLLTEKLYVFINSEDYLYKLALNSSTYILWSHKRERAWEAVLHNIDT